MIPLIAVQIGIIVGAVLGVYSRTPVGDLLSAYLLVSLFGAVILDYFVDKQFDSKGVGRSKSGSLSGNLMSFFLAICIIALLYGVNLIPNSAEFTLLTVFGKGISLISAVNFFIVALVAGYVLVLPETEGSWAFTSAWIVCAVAKIVAEPSLNTAINYIGSNLIPWKILVFFVWMLREMVTLLVGKTSSQEVIIGAQQIIQSFL